MRAGMQILALPLTTLLGHPGDLAGLRKRYDSHWGHQRQGTNFSSFCSVIAIAVASTQHAAKSAGEGTGLSDNAR